MAVPVASEAVSKVLSWGRSFTTAREPSSASGVSQK